jgi:hypothetical protein
VVALPLAGLGAVGRALRLIRPARPTAAQRVRDCAVTVA